MLPFVSIIYTASMSFFIANILYAVFFVASGESVHPVCSIQLDIKILLSSDLNGVLLVIEFQNLIVYRRVTHSVS
jgi:hypothetical protein